MIHFEHGAVALLEHRGKRRRVEHIIMLNRVYSVASSAVQVHNCFLLALSLQRLIICAWSVLICKARAPRKWRNNCFPYLSDMRTSYLQVKFFLVSHMLLVQATTVVFGFVPASLPPSALACAAMTMITSTT